MAPAGSLHPQVDIKYDEVRETVKADEYRRPVDSKILDDQLKLLGIAKT